jgi:hypothetical protein
MISNGGSHQVRKTPFPAAKTAHIIKEGIMELTG